MESQRPRVLIVGDYEHHEFTFACKWLKQHTELSAAESVAQALNKFPTRQRNWHVVVFAQARPGQIKDREVEQLAQQCPLASLVALLGSWCEGETRSGNPWPGVFRVYWHQFPAQCQQQLVLGDSSTSWQLPRTASAVERSSHAVAQHTPSHSGLVAVHTRNASFFQALAQACQIGGYSAAWAQSTDLQTVVGANVVLWDGLHCLGSAFDGTGSFDDMGAFEGLQEFCEAMSPVPVIALLSFPRHNDESLVRACGAQALLSCPFLLSDLWSLLETYESETRLTLGS